jgi:hypothetical protein
VPLNTCLHCSAYTYIKAVNEGFPRCGSCTTPTPIPSSLIWTIDPHLSLPPLHPSLLPDPSSKPRDCLYPSLPPSLPPSLLPFLTT